jgi:hypothetical protein
VLLRGPRLRGSQRDAEDRVCAEPRLVLRAVELDQRRVECALVACVEAPDGLTDLTLDVADGLQDALASVDGGVAVAQLDRLELPGRRAGGNGGAAGGAGLERDLDLDGGVPARVQDLAGVDIGD